MNSGEEALWLPSRWKCLHYALLFFSFHRVLDCFGDFGRFSGFIIKLFIFLFYIHQFHVPSSFFFWCLVQSGLFLFLKLAFFCYSSTALAGGYSCVTLTLTPLSVNSVFYGLVLLPCFTCILQPIVLLSAKEQLKLSLNATHYQLRVSIHVVTGTMFLFPSPCDDFEAC